MSNVKLIRKFRMTCPLCEKNHEIEERMSTSKTIIKGEEVEYNETYYYCCNSDEEEGEFTIGKMLSENLLSARNQYRKMHGLLTSYEIVSIRDSYGLSQVDLAKLLGWGEATISRYESKAIQDEAYDNILRIIRDDPMTCLDYLNKNGDKFTFQKRIEIRERVNERLRLYGKEYLKRKALESDYVDYQEPCVENGYRTLDIDKLETVISYLAKRVNGLYKVKLMKMLWYVDALYYKKTGKSMMGLVYKHDSLGALPIGHYKIVGLENVNVTEEEGADFTKYRFLCNENIDENMLNDDEKEVLDMVIQKFMKFSSSRIVEYMHEESAYTETSEKEMIPYSLAKDIREF